MARCKLDVTNHKFVKSIGGDKADTDLLDGLKELTERVDKEYTRGWFRQPMQRFPQYQNKVWKWDFAPEGATSSTRPGWRLYAYLADPQAKEPIPAEAFWCYAKADRENATPKEIAKMLKKHLASITIDVHLEDRFKRQMDGDGKWISVCLDCCEFAAFRVDETERDILEGTHECIAVVSN